MFVNICNWWGYSSENLNLQIVSKKFVMSYNTLIAVYEFHSFTQLFGIKYYFGKHKKEIVYWLWLEYRILFLMNNAHMTNLIVFAKTVLFQVYSHPNSKFIASIFPSVWHDQICFLWSQFCFYCPLFLIDDFFFLYSDL